MLIANSPPAVNADAHDHGGRRPNTQRRHPRAHADRLDAHPRPATPRPAGGSARRPAPAPTAESARRSASARDRNRRRQSRTVSPGTPSRSPTRRYPSRPADEQRRADHLHHVPPPRQAHVRQQHMRRPARPLATTTATRPQPPHPLPGPDHPQPRAAPASQHARPQRGHNNRPAARSASTTARSSETMSTTPSNGVTGPLATPAKVSAREPNINRTTTILSPATPPDETITTQRVAEHQPMHIGQTHNHFPAIYR